MNLGQVYTKRLVADYMVGLFTLPEKARILDPCFGRGVFVKSLLENTDYLIDAVEIDTESFVSFENPSSERCVLKNCDFFDVEDQYDGIIMNPPYVRQEEIEALASLGVTKMKLQSSCGMMAISSKANLYMYFILHSITLLRDKGELIAIFPNSWTNTPVGRQFYEQIYRNGCVTDFISVEGEAFEGAPMVDVCIMRFIKGGLGKPRHQSLRVHGNSLKVETARVVPTPPSCNLVKLQSFATIRRGITTGANKIFVNPPLFTQDHIVELLSSPRQVRGYSTQNSQQDKLLAINDGDCLKEDELTYLQNCATHILHTGKPQTLKCFIDSGFPWYYISIPSVAQIIFSYIVRNDMKFVLNDGNRNVRDNFYMISSTIDPFLLLALLNNYHVYCQLERCGKSYGKGLLKLQKYDIDAIELPHPRQLSTATKENLINLSKELVRTSDIRMIEEMTTLLNPYYGVDKAKSIFLELKSKRLGL